jgi:hypothetical protein
MSAPPFVLAPGRTMHDKIWTVEFRPRNKVLKPPLLLTIRLRLAAVITAMITDADKAPRIDHRPGSVQALLSTGHSRCLCSDFDLPIKSSGHRLKDPPTKHGGIL